MIPAAEQTQPDAPARVPRAQALRRAAAAREYLWASLIVAATTALAWSAARLLRVPDVEMLFMLGVSVTAVRFGRGPSLFAAAASVASYDYFFVPPTFTFAFSNARYILTFGVMFGSGVGLSCLMLRLRYLGQERLRLAEVARRAATMAKTEELRSVLLSTVSHDLRTPLAVITGAATALRDDPGLDAAVRRELLEDVCAEAERMERLIANLLEMTRLESGAVTPKREWVPLVEVVGAALARLERHLAGHTVRTVLPDALPLALVDPVLLEHLLVNLLENAAKYTPKGTLVELRASRQPDGLAVEVADSGPGLPPGEEERIFERFHRGATAGSSGAGLGLAIARAIAQVLGGRLVASARPGGGAVFRLTLPFTERPPEMPPDAAPEREG